MGRYGEYPAKLRFRAEASLVAVPFSKSPDKFLCQVGLLEVCCHELAKLIKLYCSIAVGVDLYSSENG